MSYTSDFLEQCKEMGVDRRVWLVIDGTLFVAPDPGANHEDLFVLATEAGVSLSNFSWRGAPQGDIMNAVARADKGYEDWVGLVQEEFDTQMATGLKFELLGPDKRSEKALV